MYANAHYLKSECWNLNNVQKVYEYLQSLSVVQLFFVLTDDSVIMVNMRILSEYVKFPMAPPKPEIFGFQFVHARKKTTKLNGDFNEETSRDPRRWMLV